MSRSYNHENEFDFHLYTTPFNDVADTLRSKISSMTIQSMKEMKHKDELHYEIQHMLGKSFALLMSKFFTRHKDVIHMLVNELGWDVNHPFTHPSDHFYGWMRKEEDEEPTLNPYQTTALEYACFMRDMELIEILVLNYGADVTQDKFRLTEVAIYGSNTMIKKQRDHIQWKDIVEFLCDNGAPKPRIEKIYTFVKHRYDMKIEDLPPDFNDALKIVSV